MIIVISAPSGTGKTTIIERLLACFPNLTYSVSVSTREKRKGEVEGRDYVFVGVEEFLKKVEREEFAEWAEVHGNYYGTPKNLLQNSLLCGKDVLLDVNVQGGLQLKKGYGKEVLLIFIIPPSLEELKRRLLNRKTESEEAIKRRLLMAEEELKYLLNYDYFVVNKKVADTVKEISTIIRAERCKVERIPKELLISLKINKRGDTEK
ncbi:MAG: guanylate kinase [bacterium]|nr:guanylate kinase [bacterium]